MQGAGLMTLTSFLSRPLRRLERYPSVMQEIDRHSEVGWSSLSTL